MSALKEIVLAKVIGAGGKTDINVQPLSVTENGDYNAPSGTAYNPVSVNVPSKDPTLINKTVNANGTYLPSADNADGYKKVVVNVPNSYAASDEGKVVSGGALVSQTAQTVTENGTMDTTYVNSVTVNVQGGEPSELPSGYTQLKYVESSGTQAINTDVAPTIETKMQIQGHFLEGNPSYYPLGGCTNPPIAVGALSAINGNSSYNSFGDKTDKLLQDSFSPYGEAPVLTIDKTSATIKTAVITSVNIGATTMSGNVNTRICLFARGNAGNIERNSKCRIFRAKIWDNGTLLRDFVPALENATEEVGMYDIVNNVFYHNVGTGVFVGGER